MAMKNGEMEDVMNDSIMCQSSMRSKSIKPRARDRKGMKGKEEGYVNKTGYNNVKN